MSPPTFLMPTPPQAMTVSEETNAYFRVGKIKPLLLGILSPMLTPTAHFFFWNRLTPSYVHP